MMRKRVHKVQDDSVDGQLQAEHLSTSYSESEWDNDDSVSV